MTSISSRHVPVSRALRLINAFVRDHRDVAHPIHEVDANVRSGQLFSLQAAACHDELTVSLAAQAAIARKLDGRCWVMVCHDNMSGSRPVVSAHVNVQMNSSDRGVHLVLTIAGITRIGTNRALPYSPERVLARGVTDSFWSELDDEVEREAVLTSHPQSMCA